MSWLVLCICYLYESVCCTVITQIYRDRQQWTSTYHDDALSTFFHFSSFWLYVVLVLVLVLVCDSFTFIFSHCKIVPVAIFFKKKIPRTTTATTTTTPTRGNTIIKIIFKYFHYPTNKWNTTIESLILYY